jgi:hypothetical protein
VNAEPHPRAWSHSALNSFETCPKRYFHLSVAKDVRDVKSEQQDWGQDVHTAMQNYFKKGTPFPLGMKQFEPLVEPLARLPGHPIVEQKLALDQQLQPCAWFADHVWVRAVVDAAFIKGTRALLVDWKTGRRKDDDDQLALSAAMMFAQMPELETVDSAFCWLQERPAQAYVRTVFTRGNVPEIWDRFLRRVAAYQEAHRTMNFPPQPGPFCRKYCPVKSCPYHGAS